MEDDVALRNVRIYPCVNSRAELVTLAEGLRLLDKMVYKIGLHVAALIAANIVMAFKHYMEYLLSKFLKVLASVLVDP